MRELKQLIQIIQDSTSKTIPLQRPTKEENEQLEQKYFNGIVEGRFQTDEEAAKNLYNSVYTDPRYITLKSRLKRKLLNYLFFIDFDKPGVNKANKYEQDCLNKIHFAKMLLNKGVYGMAEKMSKESFNSAKKTDYNYIVVQALDLLQIIYVQNQDFLRYKDVKKKIAFFQEILKKERDANTMYLEARLNLTRNSKVKRDTMEELPRIISQLHELWKHTGSYNIFDKYYKLHLMELELQNDFQGIIALTTHVNQLYQEEQLNKHRFDQRFNWFVEIIAYLRTKQYERGLALADLYLQSFDPSTHNWFTFMENYFLLALHAKNYELAKKLMANVMSNSYMSSLLEPAKNRWTLYRAYLNMFISDEVTNHFFDYQSLINSVPILVKDKEGYSLSILFLQFIHYLRLNDIESLIYRVKTMEKFFTNNLKGTLSHRSKTFFRLLRILVTNDLDIDLIAKRSKFLRKKLHELSSSSITSEDIEIIPYEDLWEFCVAILPSNKKRMIKLQTNVA